MKDLCIRCQIRPIFIKKAGLCKNCYQWEWNTGRKKLFSREMEFIKNFFTHNNWIYSPTIFRLGDVKYEPDFYDNERNVFIEVAGTRQAYKANQQKYLDFIKIFPLIKFEVRKHTGELIDITKKVVWKNK